MSEPRDIQGPEELPNSWLARIPDIPLSALTYCLTEGWGGGSGSVRGDSFFGESGEPSEALAYVAMPLQLHDGGEGETTDEGARVERVLPHDRRLPRSGFLEREQPFGAIDETPRAVYHRAEP